MKINNKIENLSRLAISYFSRKPSYLILFVTARCNAKCKMCFYWKNINNSSIKNELKLEEYERISKNFKNLFYLSIGGGEPILRNDIPEIVHLFYKNSGTRVVNITTNGGFPQKTYDIIQSIFKKCPDVKMKISISLDDIGVNHDKIRGLKGLFNKAIECYTLLSKINNENLAINIATTYSKLNKESIYSLIDYISEKLKINDHTISYVRGDTRDDMVKGITPEEYFKVWTYLINKHKNENKGFFKVFNNIIRLMYKINQKTLEKNKMILPCLAGKKFITIDEQGNVYPCEIISYLYKNKSFNMGNLRDFGYNINTILKNNKKMVSFINKSKCHCSFECGTLCNIAFSKRKIFEILKK